MRVTNKPDESGVTLWNLVRKYVKDNHPSVVIDSENAYAGGYRFRIKVLKNEVEITDAGRSPGLKAPADFPRKTIRAADPGFFKKISKACKYRGRGGVCLYRDHVRKLKANWTMMTAPDLIAVHGIDVEQKLIGAITKDLKRKMK